ncbi:MAG: ABC transporter permease [Candidatus Promineifilaceae bacterium]
MTTRLQPARPGPIWAGLRPALTVTRREVRDSLRDWRVIIPIIILTLVFPALATFTARELFRFTARFDATLITERLVPFLLLIVGFFPMSFSLVIALETFVGEKERKSLEPLLATPLSNGQLYLGKVLAALVPPMVTSYLGIGVYLIGLALAAGFSVPLRLLAQIVLLSTMQGVVMVAAAVIVSSQTNTVRAANLLASFIIVPVALLLQLEAVVLFWGNTEGLWWLVLALGVVALLLMRMGVHVFNREALLGQDIDQLRLRPMWRSLSSRFLSRNGGGLLGWYRQLGGLWPALRRPAALMALALLAGLALGMGLARLFSLPLELVGPLSSERMAANVSAFGRGLDQLPSLIFLQNVRVVLLAAVLGIFTLGVSDVLIFMLPWVVLGYLGGTLALAGEGAAAFFLAAVLPHALLEGPALVLAAAAALRWHTTVLAPAPERTVGEAWLAAAADFGRVFVGLTLPLLALAAYVEALVTPAILLRVYGG